MVDTLAKRYGWAFSEVTQNMYWEEVYEMYETASNMEVMELNDDMKFNFMLHAGTKENMNKWEDIPIPYPARNWKSNKNKKKGIIDQLDTNLHKRVALRRVKATDAEKQRFKEVSERLRKHKEDMRQLYRN